jgi:hypothetical protein
MVVGFVAALCSATAARESGLIYRFQDARASGNRTQDWVSAPSPDARASTFSLSGQL